MNSVASEETPFNPEELTSRGEPAPSQLPGESHYGQFAIEASPRRQFPDLLPGDKAKTEKMIKKQRNNIRQQVAKMTPEEFTKLTKMAPSEFAKLTKAEKEMILMRSSVDTHGNLKDFPHIHERDSKDVDAEAQNFVDLGSEDLFDDSECSSSTDEEDGLYFSKLGHKAGLKDS